MSGKKSLACTLDVSSRSGRSADFDDTEKTGKFI